MARVAKRAGIIILLIACFGLSAVGDMITSKSKRATTYYGRHARVGEILTGSNMQGAALSGWKGQENDELLYLQLSQNGIWSPNQTQLTPMPVVVRPSPPAAKIPQPNSNLPKRLAEREKRNPVVKKRLASRQTSRP